MPEVSTSPSQPSTGIIGRVSPTPPEPLLVTVSPAEVGKDDFSADMQGPVASVRTGPDGTFRLDLPAGSYTVFAAGPLTCEVVDVKVKDGRYARVDVPCQPR